ncbi:MAG: hypothetical protein M0R50_12125, partial [Candidatus Cloacimonetes bacterium]|nr:hypothetical protein [Candidatus Cloacimonadota bacterium]
MSEEKTGDRSYEKRENFKITGVNDHLYCCHCSIRVLHRISVPLKGRHFLMDRSVTKKVKISGMT